MNPIIQTMMSKDPMMPESYEPITTFWTDFSIADCYGKSAILDTFNRAFEEWKTDYKYLTELVIVLNHKIWQYYETNGEYGCLCDTLWKEADGYAAHHLKGDELKYFYEVTD